jgi:hypothetical protein
MGRHTYFIGSMGLEGAREIETVNEPAHLFDREDKLVRPETKRRVKRHGSSSLAHARHLSLISLKKFLMGFLSSAH